MLYLNFGVSDKSRNTGKTARGGDTDLNAVSFLKLLNKTIGDVLIRTYFTAAEESTALAARHVSAGTGRPRLPL